jgi:hypothetical protein
LWREEDAGGGRIATGGGGRRDKRCPVGMDEGVALASAAQKTARGGAARGGMMCCGAYSSDSRDAAAVAAMPSWTHLYSL